jgi:hypothetical protein
MVAGFAAFDQTQRAPINKTTHGGPSGPGRETDTACEPSQGKVKARLPFQAAVPEKIGVDGAVDDVQAESWHQQVFELFPHVCDVGHFVLHG